MQKETIIGIIAGILTAISMLPQLIKMIKEKKATDISPVMLITLLAGLGLWIWYGILKEDWPIILTNGFSVVVNLFIIVLRWYYKKRGKE